MQTAQLIRAKDGSHLWSDTYDRGLEDIFAVQDDIARQVASALQIVLAPGRSAARQKAVTGNLTGYDMYLEGRYLFNTRTIENVSRGIELLREATLRDPDFAEAQATYAVAIMVSRDYQPEYFGGVVPAIQAERGARRALELNGSLAEAHAALGMIEASRLRWQDADANFRRAITEEPHNGMANMWYGNLLRTLGRMRDAVPYCVDLFSCVPVYVSTSLLYNRSMPEPFIPKRPVVTSYPRMSEAAAEAEAMSKYLKEKGIDTPFGSLYDEGLRRRVKKSEFDMLIMAGGDGSVLRAGHLCAPLGVPILGVNLGRLGFLIQIDRHEWREYFDKLLNGEAWIEDRMMLHAEHIRAGDLIGEWNALNEVVVGRGQTLRPVRLSASVDGRHLRVMSRMG